MKKNNKLLITGGTGSFGNAVLNKFLNSKEFSEIRIFSRDEKKQDDLRKQVNSSKVKFYIGDVRDKSSVSNVVRGVNFIFHSAALKQVPSCEFFPIEAVKTNILGTNNVLESAIEHGVNKVIVLSTDKAAYPINAMGMSKALMEKVMIAKSRQLSDKTILCGTRYGNVMASRGSVIPLFIEQIKNNQEVTITDPTMTRFMMTLDAAVDLVMYAFENGSNGDIFVQKSPATTMGELADALIEIYNSNSKIKVIGTRHGEKHYETLVNREDMIKAENLKRYYRIPCDNRDLNYDNYYNLGDLNVSKTNEYNSNNTERLTKKELINILKKLPIVKNDLAK